MGLLRSAGFSPEEALSIMLAVSRFVVGWVLEEQALASDLNDRTSILDQPADRYPFLIEALRLAEEKSSDAAFDSALSMFFGERFSRTKRS
jgi:TetR/AcrR family tetracycline transcriptional repressor